MLIDDGCRVGLVEEIVVAQYRMADSGRARLVEGRDVEEAAGDVTDGDEGVGEEVFWVEIGETGEKGGAPCGNRVSLLVLQR